MPVVGDLIRDTSVTPDPERADRYLCDLPDSWDILYVFGGVTMATAVNAARAQVDDPRFVLRTASATFLSPIASGPVQMDVRTLRAGKGSRQLSVDMAAYGRGDARSADGRSDLHVMTTFAPDQPVSETFTDPEPPDVPKPDAIHYDVPEDYPFAQLKYHQSVEVKAATGDLPWEPGFRTGPAKWVGWFRTRTPATRADGTLDPIAYIPACDILGPAILQKRGPERDPLMVVSLELSVHFLAATRSTWLMQQSEVYHAADGYVSGMVHLWDQERRLVATALHRALMRPLNL